MSDAQELILIIIITEIPEFQGIIPITIQYYKAESKACKGQRVLKRAGQSYAGCDVLTAVIFI